MDLSGRSLNSDNCACQIHEGGRSAVRAIVAIIGSAYYAPSAPINHSADGAGAVRTWTVPNHREAGRLR